jgi:3-mercaptopyruvate sulfurtransferase SseA
VALDLAKLGVTRVRPLLGGFPEWRKHGFPVVALAVVAGAPEI